MGDGSRLYKRQQAPITRSASGAAQSAAATGTSNNPNGSSCPFGDPGATRIVGGFDPNELVGPGGYGPQDAVAADDELPYVVSFQNDPHKATAAAQDVTVTESLDPNLDWSTFQLGNIHFGSTTIMVPVGVQSYATTVTGTNVDGTPLQVDISASLDLQSGVITWTFRSIDPATGQIPTDPVAGFLPIDDATGRGEGSVSYTVRPKASDPIGTVVSAQASVVFDTNASLATNTVSNAVYAIVMAADESTDATAPARMNIRSLVGNHYADPERVSKPGIAVVGTTGTGAWQYFNGSGWVNVAPVSQTSALLLPQADALRFLPSGLAAGSAQLLFVAWDGSQGSAGRYANASVLGGGTPFSTGAGMLAVTLTAVNRSPVWLANSATLTPVLPGTTNPVGQTVQRAFGSVFSGNNNQAAGIAVTGATGTSSGTWEYALYQSATQTYAGWKSFPTLSAAAALLVSAQDMLAFVPKGSFTATATLTVRAWDQSSGTDGAMANLSKPTNVGGATAFSGKILSAKLYVNHAPTQDSPVGGIALGNFAENAATPAFTVAALAKDAHAADADKGTSLGIAIIGATGPGTTQYKLPGGTWQAVPPTVSANSALLLSAGASVRFLPVPDQAGPVSFTWQAWDQSQGTAGTLYHITAAGDPSAFSAATATATLTINPGPQVPIWTGSASALTPVLPGTYSLTGSQPAGDTVAAIFGALFADGTNSANPAIAVMALTGTVNGTWQYSRDGGTTWTSFGNVSAKQARLLSASDRIRFVPRAGFVGTATLSALAWDGTGGSDGGTATARGSAFSSTALIAMCLVNTAPTLAP
jgi:hypothetical protein